MKSNLVRLALLLLLSACTASGGLALPGITPNATSSLDLPVNSVETWDVTSAKGDKSEISTVKTASREFKFTGKFPASFFGQTVDVPISGTITYNNDGTATVQYAGPLNAKVTALYTISNSGSTVVLTTTGATPPIAPIGDKTTLNRKSVTTPTG